jgi:uncharacterized protein YjbJ (UPF0337 family)
MNVAVLRTTTPTIGTTAIADSSSRDLPLVFVAGSQWPSAPVEYLIGTTVAAYRGRKDQSMNTDVFKGKWLQLRGAVKSQWGKLTDDDVERTGGDIEQLIGRIQERYGYARDRAMQEVDAFFDRQVPSNPSGETTPSHGEDGAIGYIVLWLMGVPAGLLFGIFLLRGCN